MGSEKEQKVLDAAWSVFLKYGYRRVTMGDLAEAAGISRPALYLIFSKKEDVFRAVVRHNGDQRLEEVRQGIASAKSEREKLKVAFEIWTVKPFEMLLKSEEAEELLDCGFDFAREDIQESYGKFEAVLVPILQSLLEKASVKKLSAKQIAHVIVSSSRGFKQTCKNSSEYRDMIDQLVTLTLSGLKG